MSKRNPGGLISTTGLREPSATDQSQNSGVWDLDEQYRAGTNGTWANQSGQVYGIGNSLRFRASATAYLNRTPASAGNRKTWTWSAWVKRGRLDTAQYLFFAYSANNNTGFFRIEFSTTTIRVRGWDTTYLETNALFRDPSAWYHVVLSVDTTDATANNRITLYVNGEQITSFSSATMPTQNTDLPINNNIGHTISGSVGYAASNYFDGYMAEVNFVDGQALDPASFGYTDFNGVWQPKKYIGSYGVNGFYLPFSENNSVNNLTRNFGNGSNYRPYSQTFSDASWQKNNVTIGAAVTAPDGSNTAITLIDNSTLGNHTVYGSSAVTTVAGATYTLSAFAKAGTHTIFGIWETNATGTWATYNLVTGTVTGTTGISATIENVGNGWYRCILTLAAGGGSTGIGLSTAQSNLYPGNNYVGTGTNLFIWGAQINLGNSVDQYTPTVASAVNNDWTPNNISTTAGVTYDSMVDSPTNSSSTADTGLGGQLAGNYATWNAIAQSTVVNGTVTRSNGSLTSTDGGTTYGLASFGTIAVTTGKWYWETTITSAGGTFARVGVVDLNSSLRAGVHTAIVYCQDGGKSTGSDVFNGSAQTTYGASYTTGDIIGTAIDLDAGTITFYKNGVSQGVAYSSISGNYTPAVGDAQNATSYTFDLNCGQRPFAYAAPAGFKCLNTANLPQPTIPDGGEYFNTVLYTGNGSTNNVTGVGFQPDFVWLKGRSQGYSNSLADVLRGPTLRLKTNSTDAEAADMGLTSFDSDGFTFNGSNNNNSGETFVAWNWRANEAGVSNTAGSITSTVSAGVTQGFSVVTYTGTGANATVGHGLGVAPKMVIYKRRNSTDSWIMYNANIGAANSLTLTNPNAQGAGGSFYWNTTAPTSSVFSTGTDSAVNANGSTYVAYCFAEVPGYSRFGSYTGNGSADGAFVYTGFRPKFILIKSTTDVESWVMLDAVRNTANVVGNNLLSNVALAENAVSFARVNTDFLSNGFKLRNAGDANQSITNKNASTYIFMAFAEHPFKTSRAR